MPTFSMKRGKRFKQKAELQKAERARAFNQLVSALCANPLTPIRSLTYQKSHDNMSVDLTMIQVFLQRKEDVKTSGLPVMEELKKLESKSKEQRQVRVQLQEKILDTLEEIRRLSIEGKEVADLKIAYKGADCFTFFSRTGTYKLSCPVPMEHVEAEAVAVGGFPNARVVRSDVSYDPKKLCTNWTVICDGGARSLGYHFKLSLLVDRKFMNKDEIEAASLRKERDDYELKTIKKEIEELERKKTNVKFEAETIEKQLKFFDMCVQECEKTKLNLEEWRHASDFYTWARSSEGVEILHTHHAGNTLTERFMQAYGLQKQYDDAVRQGKAPLRGRSRLSRSSMVSLLSLSSRGDSAPLSPSLTEDTADME